MTATRSAGAPGHRHSAPGQHEHDHEPQWGLPEPLPAGERILWQGAPQWVPLAIQRFHLRKLVLYFALLLGLRAASMLSDGVPLGTALWALVPLVALSALGLGLVALIAWFTARTTAYTLTDRRVVMRIGIVLTITLNLPLKRIEAADLRPRGQGTGDIALRLLPGDHLAYLHLWPHARPWRLRRTEPMLLSLRDAQTVSETLVQAWSRVQVAHVRRPDASPAPAAARGADTTRRASAGPRHGGTAGGASGVAA